MTRTLNPEDDSTLQMQPSYSLHVRMPSTEARPFIRALFRLIQHYMEIADLRGATNKTGYRLKHQDSVCDFVYSYDPRNGGFNLQTQFKPGASNELAGRILTLVGLILSYHEKIGKPLNLNLEQSTLHDTKTLRTWGDWAVKQLYKKFPNEFKELAPAPKVRF